MKRYLVCFLHAFPLSSKMWRNQIRYFGGKFKVVAVDYPGFGGTDDSLIPDSPSIDDYAGFVEDVIAKTRAKDEKLVVVGLSMGGYIAQYIVGRKKIDVDLLVLANTRSQADSDEMRRKRIELIEKAKAEKSMRPILDFYLPALIGESESLRDEVVRMANEATLSGAIKALWAIAHRRDVTDVVKNFGEERTLLIAGKNDKLSPPEVMSGMAVVPSKQLKVLDSGHLSALERPDDFNRILEEFISGSSA